MTNETERDVPLSQIPDTIRELRERWATELTRANELEWRLSDAERGMADWQAIALENGEARARLEVAVANLQNEVQRLRDQGNIDHRARMVAERAASDFEAAWDTLCEILPTVGEECDECGGTGTDVEVEPVAYSSASNAYYERGYEVRCSNCFNGWLPKGAQPWLSKKGAA